MAQRTVGSGRRDPSAPLRMTQEGGHLRSARLGTRSFDFAQETPGGSGNREFGNWERVRWHASVPTPLRGGRAVVHTASTPQPPARHASGVGLGVRAGRRGTTPVPQPLSLPAAHPETGRGVRAPRQRESCRSLSHHAFSTSRETQTDSLGRSFPLQSAEVRPQGRQHRPCVSSTTARRTRMPLWRKAGSPRRQLERSCVAMRQMQIHLFRQNARPSA